MAHGRQLILLEAMENFRGGFLLRNSPHDQTLHSNHFNQIHFKVFPTLLKNLIFANSIQMNLT